MPPATLHTEIAIVGAGIVGLAHAYHAARAGRRVTVFERSARPVGASIRNFGMIWPIGQPPGPRLQRALRSRAHWLEMAQACGLAYDDAGSLHLAYRPDEWAVLQEFAADANEHGYRVELLTPTEVLERSPAAQPRDLLGGLLSHHELIVDPREVPGRLIPWLRETYGVQFCFETGVTHAADGRLTANGQPWTYERAFVCLGDELRWLYPELLASAPLTLVKLQMMRTAPQPQGWHMGPALAAGLTLQHYASFAHCPSLPALEQRIEEESPWFNQWGIHVMMSQNARGELIIGDTHEYGPTHDPFIDEQANRYVWDYLQTFAQMPRPEIAGRWVGVYCKETNGGSEWLHAVDPQTLLVTGLGGAGMTLSFGLAEETWSRH